jgi:hypothetical protein
MSVGASGEADEQNVGARATRRPSQPALRSFRNVRLVRELLRAEDRLLNATEEVLSTGHGTARNPGGPPPPSAPDHPEAQPIDADDGRRRRGERRYQRALAGWLASRMRTDAQTRRRASGEGTVSGSDGELGRD